MGWGRKAVLIELSSSQIFVVKYLERGLAWHQSRVEDVLYNSGRCAAQNVAPAVKFGKRGTQYSYVVLCALNFRRGRGQERSSEFKDIGTRVNSSHLSSFLEFSKKSFPQLLSDCEKDTRVLEFGRLYRSWNLVLSLTYHFHYVLCQSYSKQCTYSTFLTYWRTSPSSSP